MFVDLYDLFLFDYGVSVVKGLVVVCLIGVYWVYENDLEGCIDVWVCECVGEGVFCD